MAKFRKSDYASLIPEEELVKDIMTCHGDYYAGAQERVQERVSHLEEVLTKLLTGFTSKGNITDLAEVFGYEEVK